MRCPSCGYDLSGDPAIDRLSDGDRVTCPECGAVVDPAAMPVGSGRESTARVLFWIAGTLALTPLAAHAMAHLALIGAWVELGRWPHRMGRDDPKGIDAAEPFMSLAFLLLQLAVGSLLLQGVILIWIAICRQWGWLWRTVLVQVVVFGVGFVLMGWDPAEVWVWLFD